MALTTLRLYSPHKLQERFHKLAAIHRFFVAAWSRQTGKSTAALNHMLKYAWENPGKTLWFIAPTHSQATVQYRRMIGMLFPCRRIILSRHKTELRIKLINNSVIVFKSGDNPDSLRTETLDGAVIDEMRDQSPELWSMIVRPMLGTTGGWCIFISTPRGFDTFYDLFEAALKDTLGEWGCMQAPVTECPLWSEKEILSAKRDMSEAEFAQEMMAEFRDIAKGKAYLDYTQANVSTTNPFAPPGQAVSPYLPIVLGADFNLNPMSWTLGQNRAHDWHWFDEINLEDSHTPEASAELVQKLLALKEAGHKTTPMLIVCGDASGKAGQRAAAAQSDYDILFAALREAGISYQDKTPDSNPGVKDRVNNVNQKCRDATGVVHMTVNNVTCPMLHKDLQRVTWKVGGGYTLDPGPTRMLTHPSDSIGYPLWAMSPIKPINKVGRLRVITR